MSTWNPFESYIGPGSEPTGCGAITLPAVTTPQCPADYAAYEGEITDILMSTVAKVDGEWVASFPPDNYLYDGDWDAAVSAGAKRLVVIGDKPLAETKVLTLGKRWRKIKDRFHTLTIDITDMSVLNYEFVRTLQRDKKVAVNWKSIDGWNAGGDEMVIVDVDTAGIIWPRGEGGLMSGQLVLTWSNKFDPPAGLAIAGTSPLTAKAKKPAKPGSKAPAATTPNEVTGKNGDDQGDESKKAA